jgi:hypothetical protein
MHHRSFLLLLITIIVVGVDASSNMTDICICPSIPSSLSINVKGWDSYDRWNPVGRFLTALDGILWVALCLVGSAIILSITLSQGMQAIADAVKQNQLRNVE